MAAQPWWHLALIIAGWTFAAAGVLLLLWALFGDRSRGRRRCPKCWYDMTGVPGLMCPECGRAAKHERGVLRTRRRWRGVAAAMIVLAIGLSAFGVRLATDPGWVRQLPTAALLRLWRPVPPPPLFYLSDDGISSVFSQVYVAPTPAATPWSLHSWWNDVQAAMAFEVWNRASDQRITSAQGNRILRALYPPDVLAIHGGAVAPKRWPEGRPVPVIVTNIKRAVDINGLAVRSEPRDIVVIAWPIKSSPSGDGEIDLPVAIDVVRGRVLLGQLHTTCRLKPCKPGEPLFRPRDDDTTNALVQQALALRVRERPDGGVFIVYDERTSDQKWDRLPMGVNGHFEIRLEDEVIGRGNIRTVWTGTVQSNWHAPSVQWSADGERRFQAHWPRTRVVVRGESLVSESDYLEWPFDKVSECWTGEFVTSLRPAPLPAERRLPQEAS